MYLGCFLGDSLILQRPVEVCTCFKPEAREERDLN